MLKEFETPNEIREVLLSLLNTSGTLAGISLALVSIIHFGATEKASETVADDMFLFSSLGFLVVCYLIFFALRSIRSPGFRGWANAIDGLFLLSLTLLVLAGFIALYTFL